MKEMKKFKMSPTTQMKGMQKFKQAINVKNAKKEEQLKMKAQETSIMEQKDDDSKTEISDSLRQLIMESYSTE